MRIDNQPDKQLCMQKQMNKVRTTTKIYNASRQVLLAHVPLLVIVGIYVAACILLRRVYNVETHLFYPTCRWVFNITLFYLVIYPFHVMFVLRPRRPITHIKNRIKCTTMEQVITFFVVAVAVAASMVAFMRIKPLIPVIHPFAWDATFARWDAALHGTDAWRLVHPYLSHPLVTRAMVAVYVFYFFVVIPAVPWQAIKCNDSTRRMQYLLTFVLCWALLGGVTAIIFSSAGPCFYRYVVPGPDRYAELMFYLQSPTTPVSVIMESQRNLWYVYDNHEYKYLFAITAMPSLHVAITFLLVLISRRRVTRILSVIFTILVSLSCVHLGWHYAIDVYAGIIGAWLIWWIVGLCLRGRLTFPVWRTQNAP